VPGVASTVLHRVAKQRTSVYGSAAWARWRRVSLAAAVGLSRPCARARADNVVVKSVFAGLALPWICERWDPRLVLMSRSALNTVASWHRLGWERPFAGHPVLGGDDPAPLLAELAPDRAFPPAPPAGRKLERVTWELSALMAVMSDEVARRPGSMVVRHEDLCVDPVERFGKVFTELGLEWTPQTEAYLAERNRPGDGVYDTARLAAEEPTSWRRTLTADDAARIADVTAGFGIAW
jgi:hypothetical protein